MRPAPVACDGCDKPLEPFDGVTFPLAYVWREHEFGAVSFAYCWCSDCSDANPKPGVVDSILRRAERQSPKWHEAVGDYMVDHAYMREQREAQR